MKRFLLLFLPAALFISEAVLSLPAVSEWVSGQLGLTPFAIQALLGGILFAVFMANQYVSVWRPFRRFMRFNQTRARILRSMAEGVIQAYRAEGIELRLNVMLLDRPWFARLEPASGNFKKRRLSFRPERLRIWWNSSNMNQAGDRGMSMTVMQGVCGLAYREGEAVIAGLTAESIPQFNLNADQANSTKDVKFILSCPIRKMDLDSLESTAEIIGVINIDSRDASAQGLADDDEVCKDLRDRAHAFAELCSLLF